MSIRSWLLGSVGVLALGTPALAADDAPVRTTPFPDVPRTHWAFAAVEELRERGILRGYPPQQVSNPAPRPPRKAPARRPRSRRHRQSSTGK